MPKKNFGELIGLFILFVIKLSIRIKKSMLIKEINKDGILRITLNDVDNKNALSSSMIQELKEAIDESNSNDSIKVIVIAAEGNVFCSGHNLKEINRARSDNDDGELFFIELFRECSLLMQKLVDCRKPIIAEVDGVATAAGCQLVASCDLAISSDNSRFATPGVNIGLFCSTPMVALTRSVSKKDAMMMLLTGDMINASEAKRISLINDHVPVEDLKKSVIDLAKNISKKSSSIIELGKETFYKQLNLNLEDAYKKASEVMVKNALKDDAVEGINAFIEKRDPNWKEND